MNRRGSVNVTLLVFLSLFIIVIALYSFLVHSKVDTGINDPRLLEKNYALEERYQSELLFKGDGQIVNNYYAQTRNYVANSKLNINSFSISINNETREVSSSANNEKIVFDYGTVSLSDSISNAGKVMIDNSYVFDLRVELNLTQLGLHSFDDINSMVNYCRSNSNPSILKDCLDSKLINFESAVGNDSRISFKSRREFDINGQIRNMEFNVSI